MDHKAGLRKGTEVELHSDSLHNGMVHVSFVVIS